MTFDSALSLIDQYSTWLYAVGLIALVFALFELYQARRRSAATIFSLEKELAAARTKRGRTSLVAVLAFLAVLTAIEFAVLPSQPPQPTPQPTSTRLVIEAPTLPPVTATPTLTRIPTRPRPTALPPTEVPTSTPAPPPPCPLPGVCITSPRANEVVSGEVAVLGTASIEAFQFYKVEYGIGERPEQWSSIGDVRHTSVVDRQLAVWNTSGFPEGAYVLRLTVVDVTGNFAPPFEVRVVLQN